ncbi:serine hydrolase domain-containing protein [Sorangium sp. So ce131]|uniref:serine hydrolase domain-containing protein n=1 Tax=Sorangium sp. So ce131 TaxID=3133282 RepID=UPI003F628DB5
MKSKSLALLAAASVAYLSSTPSAHAQPVIDIPSIDLPPFSSLVYGSPSSVGMDRAALQSAVDELEDAVLDDHIKGAVILVARHGKIVLHQAVGQRDGLNEAVPGMSWKPMPADGMFDLESMTKPFTAFLAMKMQESGDFPGFNINNTVISYFPEFAMSSDPEGSTATVRDLMRYASGEDMDYFGDPENGVLDDADPWHTLLDTPLYYSPNQKVLYSDLGYRILGHVLEKVGNSSLQKLMKKYIFDPLEMYDTTFRPSEYMPEKQARFVGTAYSAIRGRYLRGEVQDETDYHLESTTQIPTPASGLRDQLTGCDGLFSTAWDLAKFAQMLLDRGDYRTWCLDSPLSPEKKKRCTRSLLSPTAIDAMATNQTDGVGLSTASLTYAENLFYANKGYGWELWNAGAWPGGSFTSTSAYSKTGGAGTLMVIDPDPARDLFMILLTNHGLPKFDNFGRDSAGNLYWGEFDDMLTNIRAETISQIVFSSAAP